MSDQTQLLRQRVDTVISKRAQGDANKFPASSEPAYAEIVRQLFGAEDVARSEGEHIPVAWVRHKHAAPKLGKNITSVPGGSGTAKHKTTDKSTPPPRPVVKVYNWKGKYHFEFRD